MVKITVDKPDKELKDLRKKVKDKENMELMFTEKELLKEKLEKGTIKSVAKKIGKSLFKKLMK